MAGPRDVPRPPETSGFLYKWTNYWRGYEKMWFVLSGGVLSYYRNQKETPFVCRGSISLRGAEIRSEKSSNFSVINEEVSYYIKAEYVEEKQRWIDALSGARDLEFHEQTGSDTSASALTSTFKKKLDDMEASSVLMETHCQNLLRALSEMESSDSAGISTISSVEEVKKQEAMFRTSYASTVEVCSDYLHLVERHIDKWVSLVHGEKQCSILLDRSTNNDTFCESDATPSFPGPSHLRKGNTTVHTYPAVLKSDGSRMLSNREQLLPLQSSLQPEHRKRRSRVPDRLPVTAHFWSVMKHVVGPNPAKICVPVDLFEPISFLQRLTEDFEYAHILDRASDVKDPGEQLAYMAGFAISTYSGSINRIGKPFNPILGETFEWDRTDDLGWRSIAEQVSHYPPVSALYCEGKQWECWQEQSMTTKFRGTYVQIIPLGEIHVKFKSGNHYVWKRVITNIRNVIIGKPWIDQEGDMQIVCHTNGFKCKVNFLKPNLWGTEAYKVKGTGSDREGQIQFHVEGGYDSKVEITKNANKIADPKVIWERTMPSSDSDKYYNFTLFACQLNEMEDGVAPTDSRHRPDQRYMEEGKWDRANEEKNILEDRQRTAIKSRQETSPSNVDPYVPIWFRKLKDGDTQTDMHVFQGEYWSCKLKQDWTRCPDIFT